MKIKKENNREILIASLFVPVSLVY